MLEWRRKMLENKKTELISDIENLRGRRDLYTEKLDLYRRGLKIIEQRIPKKVTKLDKIIKRLSS